jgi:hypothetical protein
MTEISRVAQTIDNAQAAIRRLEAAIRKYDDLFQIAVSIAASGERGPQFHDILLGVEENIVAVKDSKLKALYDKLVDDYRDPDKQNKSTLDVDFAAFISRLTRASDQAAMEANEADIEVKQFLGLLADKGVYGPSYWRP